MERFMILYESVYQDLYRLAYYYLGNPQDAEDMVGETVLKAFEKFSSLKNEECFRSWIFKILVNQCNSHFRKSIIRKNTPLEKEPSFHPILEDRVIAGDLMSVLSAEERKIVALAVFGGYKGEEIAKIMHLRHSTLRSRYRRALKKMEQAILAEEVQYGQ